MGVCLACSVFVWKMLPETKDRTLEEIGRSWLRPEGKTGGRVRPAGTTEDGTR